MQLVSVPFPLEIVVLGAIVIAITILRGISGNKRMKALKEVADQLGLTFEGEDWSHANRAPQLETPLFSQGPDGEIYNIMADSRDEMERSFFDYTFGARRATVRQTVATFSQDAWLPQFEIAPQDILHKLGDAIVHKEIHFESHPELAQRFRILSVDEEKARKWFSPELLGYLETCDGKPRWHIEGFGRTLVIYQRGKQVKPEEFPAFTQETTEMAKKFLSLAG